VYRVSDEGVSAPKVVKEVKPQYTKEAMDAKVQGNVILQGVVTEEGWMSDIKVVKPLEASLDRAAVDAALDWRFEPGRKDGHPVRVQVTLELRFELRDTPPS
jgi:protein TonB